MKKLVLRVVQALMLVVLFSFWGVAGTAFWLASVVRTFCVFTAVFLYSMFTGQRPPDGLHDLEVMTDLWFRGFRSALDQVYGNPANNSTLDKRNGRLLLEVVWTSVFVYILALAWRGQLLISFGHYGHEIAEFFCGVANAIGDWFSGLAWGWRAIMDVVLLIGGVVFGTFFGVAVMAEDNRRAASKAAKRAKRTLTEDP